MGKKSQKGKLTGSGAVWNRARERTQSESRDNENDNNKTRVTGKHSNKLKINRNHSQDKDISVSCERDESLFPKYSYWIVCAWTLILRIWYVTTPANWWILHPDEVYQTIEVAHTDAFGYGFRTYEYIPPPGNSTYSDAHARSAELGMYSLRSFLLVKLLSVVMVMADICGLPWSPFLVVKVFHAIVTSFLPVSVYKFTKALYRSRDIAILASVFISLSLTLNVFGTHSLINSFLSTFVFLALTPFAQALSTCLECTQNKNIAGKNSSSSPTCTDKSTHMNGSVEGVTKLNGMSSNSYNHSSNKASEINGHATAMNGNIPHYTNGHLPNGSVSDTISKEGKHNNVFSWVAYIFSLQKANHNVFEKHSNGINLGYHNGDINANIIKKNVKPCDTPCAKPEIKTDENYSSWHMPKFDEIKLDNSIMQTLLFGVLLGLLVYCRTDLILLPAVIFVVYLDAVLKNFYGFICVISYYVVGICLALVIGGYIDLIYYGVWFITMKQWFKFNILSEMSALVFGDGSDTFYLYSLFRLEPLHLFVCVVLLVDIIVFHTTFTDQKSKSSLYGNNFIHRNISYVFYMLLFIYSLTGHKEFRFIHNVIVILYICFARSVFTLCRTGLQNVFPENQNKSQYYTYFCYSMLAVVFSSHIYTFIFMDTSAISKWTYRGEVDADANQCMDFLRQQTNVKGVFMDRSIYSTGGYSMLHKDVPLLALNMNEFVEYDVNSRFNDSRYFSHNIDSRFYIVDRISEFVSIYNTPHVVKILIEKPQYNYLILNPDRRFLDIGYTKVFTTKQAVVFKRTFRDADERELARSAKRTPMGNNATILEYEGQWLKHFGLFKKAEERLVLSNHIDKKRLGPFQILLKMFHELGERQKYASVMESCMEVFTKEQCRSSHKPIILHQGYHRAIV